MRADPEEYIALDPPRSRFPMVELLLALAVVAGLVAFWYLKVEKRPPETPAETPVVTVPATPSEVPPTPDIPQREEAATVIEPETAGTTAKAEPAKPKPLTPQDGDALLRSQLAAAGARAVLNKMLSSQQPLEVSAALIDGLGHGVILRKFVSASPPSQAFSVVTEDDATYMDSTGYLRYDDFAAAVAALDSGVLVNMFHTLRPLYEQVYGYLGLDPGDFDNAVIRTLDLILATPEIGEPIALKPKSGRYIYADPSLESLPDLQKQLLRMGPDNVRRIKQQAQSVRAGLLAQ